MTNLFYLTSFRIVGRIFRCFYAGRNYPLRQSADAQNLCAMAMHHGKLYVFGNAGKVCGYASKGGKVFILCDMVDRC